MGILQDNIHAHKVADGVILLLQNKSGCISTLSVRDTCKPILLLLLSFPPPG